jgi:hypothetical protein
MTPFVSNLLTTLGAVTLAAFGGAAVVFSEIDDAPGGVVIGFLLICVAVGLGTRAAIRGR